MGSIKSGIRSAIRSGNCRRSNAQFSMLNVQFSSEPLTKKHTPMEGETLASRTHEFGPLMEGEPVASRTHEFGPPMEGETLASRTHEFGSAQPRPLVGSSRERGL